MVTYLLLLLYFTSHLLLPSTSSFHLHTPSHLCHLTFLLFSSYSANDYCIQGTRSTISAKDVLNACDELELPEITKKLKEVLEGKLLSYSLLRISPSYLFPFPSSSKLLKLSKFSKLSKPSKLSKLSFTYHSLCLSLLLIFIIFFLSLQHSKKNSLRRKKRGRTKKKKRAKLMTLLDLSPLLCILLNHTLNNYCFHLFYSYFLSLFYSIFFVSDLLERLFLDTIKLLIQNKKREEKEERHV